MKKKISENTLNVLYVLKNNMLMIGDGITYVVNDFKYETIEVEEKYFFGLKKKRIKNIYLTDLSIIDNKHIRRLNDDDAWGLICDLNPYVDKQG